MVIQMVSIILQAAFLLITHEDQVDRIMVFLAIILQTKLLKKMPLSIQMQVRNKFLILNLIYQVKIKLLKWLFKKLQIILVLLE